VGARPTRYFTPPAFPPLASPFARDFAASDRTQEGTDCAAPPHSQLVDSVAASFPAAAEHRPSNGGRGRGPGAAVAGGWVRLRPAPGRALQRHREPLADRELEGWRTCGGDRSRASSRVKAPRPASREEIIRRYGVVALFSPPLYLALFDQIGAIRKN
jgi:hypothetical protein